MAGSQTLPLYLVVTSRALAPSLQLLIDRRKSDFECKTLYVDDFTGSPANLTTTKIREEIKNAFSLRFSNQSPGAILIGGAHSVVPAHTYKREIHAGTEAFLSDHFYSEFEDNYYPVVSVGRLPALTIEEMDTMVRNILDYENMDGQWRKKFWNCGYKDGKYKDQFIMPIKMINTMLQGRIDVEWATFNMSNPEILNQGLEEFYTNLNQGVAVVNYNGHGQAPWQGSVSVNDLTRIIPSEGLPVVICSACNNGMINADDCLASSWMLENKSVGVIASTSFSHVWINGEFDSSLVRFMTQNDLCLGDILNLAKTETLKNNMEDQYDKPLSVDNARMYLLLGDPALKLRAAFE